MLRVCRGSRHELWPSLIVAVVATVVFRGHMPIKPIDTIGYPAVLLVAWFMALNALIGWNRRDGVLRDLSILWFALLSITLAVVLYGAFTTRVWSNR